MRYSGQIVPTTGAGQEPTSVNSMMVGSVAIRECGVSEVM